MKEATQILLDLKRRIVKPVYFLSGEEPYYIDAISDYIEKNLLPESERDFNQSVVYGKDTPLATILALAKQFPMMGEYNVVIVKEAQNIKELNKKVSDDSDDSDPATTSGNITQLLVDYVSAPLATTVLVFCYKYKKLDKRSAVAKALQKKAVFLESNKIYDNQLPPWITEVAKEKGYNISPKAVFLLAEYLGTDLSRIVNEIEKLAISLEPGKEISAEMVQENIGISKEFNTFELQDALAKKDVLKANRIINYFAANEKQNPVPVVLALLYSYFSKVLKYHFIPDKNKSAVAQSLGVNPFFVDGYAKAAANYSSQKLRFVFSCLKECDLKSKGVDNAGINNGELMKELVFKILH